MSVEAVVAAGIEALQRGDAGTARRAFQQVADAGQAAPMLWVLLSQACRMQGDHAAEEAAIDRALAMQPNDLRALIIKGDCRARAGDDRAASSFYAPALAIAAANRPLPPDFDAEVSRIESAMRAIDGRYQGFLDARLAESGVVAGAVSKRFAQSIDLLTTGKTIYFQEPTSFFFPGLPQIQFYEREAFPWLAEVETAVPAIQAELAALLGDFSPYVELKPGRPAPANPLLNDPKWGALYLWKGGEPTEHAARCPATMKALEAAPIPHIRSRSPMALFSRLKPGTHIVSHNGLLNTRLICHIPLIVPPGCRFRVGNETREWEEGRALIFDDSIEHEAWNDGTEDRVVLLFEIWRPEISEAERAGLTTLFEAINDYGGLGEDAG